MDNDKAVFPLIFAGLQSFENNAGSFFLRTLADVLMQNYQTMDFNTMMTKVSSWLFSNCNFCFKYMYKEINTRYKVHLIYNLSCGYSPAGDKTSVWAGHSL